MNNNLDPQNVSKDSIAESKELGLDDKSTVEIVHLIENLKDDSSNADVQQDSTVPADETDPANALSENQTNELHWQPLHRKKSSELVRWKAGQISDLLESYISFREAHNWN
ncbi:hypothetical protein MBANPS3_008147 [Mucor bainieri]